MMPFWFDGLDYWVPNGWDVAIFGGRLYRRDRSRYRPDKWILFDGSVEKGV